MKKKRNEIILFSCILTFIFFVQFLFQWKILTQRKSLLDTDPFVLVGHAYSFFKSGEIGSWGPAYPPGFRIFSASCLSLLISPDFRVIYYFFKFAPICILSFYFLIIVVIIKRIFKKNYFLLLILPLILTSDYLVYRLDFFVSSNIATLLILISLLIFITKCPLYLFSFFITAVFLFNPVVAFFYLISMVLFGFIKLLHMEKKFKRVIIKLCIKTSIISIILFIPYIIFISTYGYDILDLVKFYYNISSLPNSFQVVKINKLPNDYFLGIIEWIYRVLVYWVPEDPIWRKRLFTQNQIIYSFFFYFALFGLFLSIKKNAEKQKRNLIVYCKTVVVLMLIIFFLPILIPNNLFINMFPFWMYMRTLEFFYAPILIIECFAIYYIIKKAKILRIYLVQNNELYKKLMHRKNLSKIINIEKLIIAIFLVSSYSYFTVHSVQNNYHEVGNYHYSDDQINTIFFIKGNIPAGSKILVPSITYSPASNWIYSLLKYHQYSVWDFSNPNWYNPIEVYLYQNNISYLVVDKWLTNSTQITGFLILHQNMTIVYENYQNTIIKIN